MWTDVNGSFTDVISFGAVDLGSSLFPFSFSWEAQV